MLQEPYLTRLEAAQAFAMHIGHRDQDQAVALLSPVVTFRVSRETMTRTLRSPEVSRSQRTFVNLPNGQRGPLRPSSGKTGWLASTMWPRGPMSRRSCRVAGSQVASFSFSDSAQTTRSMRSSSYPKIQLPPGVSFERDGSRGSVEDLSGVARRQRLDSCSVSQPVNRSSERFLASAGGLLVELLESSGHAFDPTIAVVDGDP